jgi:transposase
MAEAARAFSGEIPVERRFPLHLEPSIGSIRDLYDQAKQSRWDPERDIPWASFDPSRYTPAVLAAAALSWSRKAWIEYGGLPETPALIIRFCLEHERESDPKYFLTVRNTEEAWHLDCCHRFAELCGGFVETPASPTYAALFNQGLHREALDASRNLDAYVAAHIGIQDGLDLELTRLHRDNTTDPVARAILDRLVADKTRHAAFGWFYLGSRAAGWDEADRQTIAAEVEHVVRDVEWAGFRCVWLSDAADIADADRITSEAGLGAAAREQEEPVLRRYLAEAAAQFAKLGVEVSFA